MLASDRAGWTGGLVLRRRVPLVKDYLHSHGNVIGWRREE
jgi:hypothetical protein